MGIGLRTRLRRIKRGAGDMRRAAPALKQRAMVGLRRSLSRVMTPEELAHHYARLKARHFGQPDQLPIPSGTMLAMRQTTGPDAQEADACHQFANGIQVHHRHLLPQQLERYADHGNLHEPVEEDWLQRLLDMVDRRPLTFLDIGAALGYYDIVVRRRHADARIIAVDPNPSMAEAFSQTMALNGVSEDGMTFLPLAVYPSGDTVPLALKTFSSHVVEGQAGRPAAEAIEVEAADLGDLLDRVGQPVDIAKMDIQGAELAVLTQAADILAEGRVAHWIVGTHGLAIHRTLLRLLAEHHEILFEDPTPDGQPDGLLVARHRAA